MHLAGFTITNDVYVPERVKPDTLFEKKYVDLRWLEKRLYNDEEVLWLPLVPYDHPHRIEWKMRRQSTRRLIKYLQQKKQKLHILEVGCGNGWLSHHLSMIQQSEVIGTDINFTELQQAARVFQGAKGLQFLYGDIRTEIVDHLQFDIIVFSASIQYFPSFEEIMDIAMRLLKKGGEIHILDTHFYREDDTETARRRTCAYFDHLGFPEMALHYFHHHFGELNNYRSRILYKTSRLRKYFLKNSNPFPWICIYKD